MLSFLAMLATVLITLVVLAGFLAIAAVLIFEYAALLTFWIKHSLKDSSGPQMPADLNSPA